MYQKISIFLILILVYIEKDVKSPSIPLYGIPERDTNLPYADTNEDFAGIHSPVIYL